MAKLFQQIRVGPVTDDAVTAKTGKTWDEWCKILDRAGARMMEHREIALLLHEEMGVPTWWSQVVATGYENERGIRQDERGGPAGKRYEVTLTKIVAAGREATWAAWQDRAMLARWLPDVEFAVSKTVAPKMMELKWPDEKRVTVKFFERRGRTRVVVTQARLAENETDAARRYWSAALDEFQVLMAAPRA
jgi:uncharacterized protein YndB with AHSA1/START domain